MTERDQEHQDKEIEKMTEEIKKIKHDIEFDSKRYTIQVVSTAIALIGATVVLTTLIFRLLGMLK